MLSLFLIIVSIVNTLYIHVILFFPMVIYIGSMSLFTEIFLMWLVSETVLLMGRHIFNGTTDKIYQYAYTIFILDTIMTEDDKIINEPNIYQCEYMTTLFNREKQILRPYSNHTPKTRCMYTPFKGFVGANFGLAHRQCHATTYKLLNNSKYSINLYSPEIHT